jgi:cell division initiation protein
VTTQPTGAYGSPRRQRGTPFSPETIRAIEFPRSPFGRRGYHEDEVRRFLGRIAEDIVASNTENGYLRAEIERLRNWYRQAGVEIDDETTRRPPNGQAIAMMSQAQQAADQQIAQAEDYARRMLADAHRQYEEILREAQRRALSATEQSTAERPTWQGRDEDRIHLERRIGWLRAFAKVTQVQLRSTLEALTRELDKLDDLPTENGERVRAAEQRLPQAKGERGGADRPAPRP